MMISVRWRSRRRLISRRGKGDGSDREKLERAGDGCIDLNWRDEGTAVVDGGWKEIWAWLRCSRDAESCVAMSRFWYHCERKEAVRGRRAGTSCGCCIREGAREDVACDTLCDLQGSGRQGRAFETDDGS